MIAYAFVPSAHANPVDGVVSAGSADITANGKTLDITQHSDKAIIDWRGFDIAHDETTNFYQPSSSSIILNRVHSSQASQIDGKLNANGNVVIINQNGIVFGAGSQVDVHGLVATTSDTTNAQFMNNAQVRFDLPGNTSASIVNNGTITAHDAGLVGFVAPNVENNGVITANLGRVHLAAGDKATVDFYGDGLLEVEASDQLQHEIVKNTGTITADGGKIAMTAAKGGQVVSSLINAQGVIKAQSVGVRNGEIVIGGHKNVKVSGTINASSTTGKGGKVTITADNIKLDTNARINASGHTGGGTILIGGDYQGSGTTPRAKTLIVEQGAYIRNDALTSGDGGKTILWSDEFTSFAGLISGKGGAQGGDGGFAEVSGKDVLQFSGYADLSADEEAGFSFGTLLLDPTDITISSAGDSGGAFGSSTYTPSAGTSFINVSTLQTQLAGGANVVINTASGQSSPGNITVANGFTWSSTRNLTLNATNDIVINGVITASGSAAIALNGRDITMNSNISVGGTGYIYAYATRDVTVASGVTLTSGPTGTIQLRAAGGVITNTGVVNLNGVLNVGSSGTLSLLSGLNSLGVRSTDLDLNTSNLLVQNGTLSAIGISGFRDVTVARNLPSGGNVLITAERNLTINSGVTVTTGGSSIAQLRAAGGVITNTGVYTNSGTLSLGGGGTFMLASGLDSLGARTTDLTLNTTNTVLQSTLPTVLITGFRDITIDRNLTSTAGVTINAERHLTINSGSTITGTGLNLKSSTTAGTAGTGAFTLAGAISASTGTLILQSGLDSLGSRVDLVLDSSHFTATGTATGVNISGFRDTTINRNLTASASIVVLSDRNLNIGSGVVLTTGAAGSLSLRAAGGVIANVGVLTNSGTWSMGTGTLTLASGVDTLGDRADLTLNGSNLTLAGNIAAGNITGFRDVTLGRTISVTGALTIAAQRDLTISSAITSSSSSTYSLTSLQDVTVGADVIGTNSGGALVMQSGRNFTINSGANVSVLGSVSLKAAGGVITNTGLLNLNGTITAGASTVTMLSGVDGSGNRNDLTINTNIAQQTGTMGGMTITGYRDVTLARNISFVTATSITAERNLTVNSGVTVTTAPANSLTLKSAGGVITNTGQLVINGIINQGTSLLTLSSGVDGSGNRNDLVLNSSNLLLQGLTVGATTITGFRDITLDRALTATSTMTITAERNLTINAALGSTSLLLKAAGGLATNEGLLSLNSTLTQGTGTFGLVSGKNGSGVNSVDLTLTDNVNFIRSGASVGTVGISGFNDITLNTDLTSSASISLTAGRDVLSNGYIRTGPSDNYLINAGRDITINGSFLGGSGTGTFEAYAGRNVTLGSGAVLNPGTSGSVYLNAAGGNVANTGVVTINGTLDLNTSSTINLINGLDGSGNRTQDITFNNSNLTYGTTFSGFSISGFRDITVARNINTTSGLTLIAERNLTINSGVTITPATTGTVTLKSAGGVITNAGQLFLNGTINMGTAPLIMSSGKDGSGNYADLVFTTSNITMQGAALGAITLSGYRDIAFNRTLVGGLYTVTADRDFSNNAVMTGAISITAGRDITFGANWGNIASSVSMVATAGRNLTVNSGVTVAAGLTGAVSLRAAGGVATNVGSLVLDGALGLGNGTFTLLSGLDTVGGTAAQDLSLTNANITQLNTVIGTTSITGFRDISISKALNGNAAITLNAARDVNVNGAITSSTTGNLTYTAGRDILIGANQTLTNTTSTADLVFTAARNLTINSGVVLQSGLIGSTTLRAAGNAIANTGRLILDGLIHAGSGGMTLVNGLDLAGTRTNDLIISTANLTYQGAAQGSVSVTGFRDVVINRNLNSGTTTVTAERNLTINPGILITAGATHTHTYRAAGNIIGNTGILTLAGATIHMGTGGLALTSGLDGSGNRQDLTLDNSILTLQGANMGGLVLSGYRDIIFARNLTIAGGSSTATAQRNVIINSGVTLTANGTNIALISAGNAIANAGQVFINGNVTLGTSGLTLVNGLDTSGNRTDLTLNDSNLTLSGATMGGLSISGYRDVTLAKNLAFTSTVSVVAERNLIINNGITLTAAPTSSTTLRAGGATSANTGDLNFNGTLHMGTGVLVMSTGKDGSGQRTKDLTLNNSWLTYQGTQGSLSGLSLSGYRDITIASDLNFTGTSSAIVADRHLTINSGVTIQSAANSVTLRSANTATDALGLFSLNGLIRMGTATLTISSAWGNDGNYTDLVLDSSHLQYIGASTGGLTVQGWRDITLGTSFNGGSLFISSYRDVNIASGVTMTTSGGSGNLTLSAAAGNIAGVGKLNMNGIINMQGSGTVMLSSGVDSVGNRNDFTLSNSNYSQGGTVNNFSLLGFRDVVLDKNIVSNGFLSINAQRDLTINSGTTLTSGSNKNMGLRAAGGVLGQSGILTNNGTVRVGSGLTVFSGADSTSRGADFTWDNSHWQAQAADIGFLDINGFRDVIFSENVTLNGDSIIQAQRDIKVDAGKTLTIAGNSGLTLYAANQTYDRGVISIAGTVSMPGTGKLYLHSGKNSSGLYEDLVWDGTTPHITRSGSTMAGFYAAGYRDIIIAQDINSTAALYLKAGRNVVINNGVTVTAGGAGTSGITKLTAGNGPDSSNGVVTVNGLVKYGTGEFTLTNGNDAASTDLVFDNTHFLANGAYAGNVIISGFRDITLGSNLNSNGDVTITAQRNLTASSGANLTATTTGTDISLYAANNIVTNQGVLRLDGRIVGKSTVVNLTSGLDVNGGADFTFDGTNITNTGTGNYGGLRLNGFRDITFTSDYLSNAFVSVTAARNLTINSGVTLRGGPNSSFILNAAGGNSANAGVLHMNGTVYMGKLNTRFTTGYDAATGERPDLVFDPSKYIYHDTARQVSSLILDGFRDITLNQGVAYTANTTPGTIDVRSTRDLTIAAGVTMVAPNNATFAAGRDFINNSGSNAITSTNGRYVIYSTDPTTSKMGGLAYDFRVFNCVYGSACASLPGSGNGFVFSNNGTLEIISNIKAGTSLPSAVVRATQSADANISVATANTSYSTTTSSTVLEAPQSFAYHSSFSGQQGQDGADYILTFAPELAAQFDLKNWQF